MTNAEKLLKVDAEEFIDKYTEWYFSKERELEKGNKDVYEFLRAECKPTLTEDERVILRNIDQDNYKAIGRKKDMLYLVDATPNFLGGGKNDEEVFWYCFHRLFDFIKERRRIFYRGTVRR